MANEENTSDSTLEGGKMEKIWILKCKEDIFEAESWELKVFFLANIKNFFY